jgi:hypothetical protein
MAITESFRAKRLTSLLLALRDQRGLPGNMLLGQRIPTVNTTDDDILGEYQGNVYIADVLADDNVAVVRNSGRIVPVAHAVPNIKHGTNLTQRMIEDILNLARRGVDLVSDEVGLGAWEMRIMDDLRMGVEQRIEALKWAMLTDGMSFSYDRLGIKIDTGGISWRMPADLKVTMTPAITDAANAKPVTTIWNLKLIAQTRYGYTYDRITMSTAAFRAMIATDEYKTLAAQYLPTNITFTNLNTVNLNQQRLLADQVLGLTIELFDGQFISQSNDGSESGGRYLPIGLGVLSSTADDGDASVWGFGNAIPTEATVASLVGAGNVLGGMTGVDGSYGPIAYAEGTLNPPSITYWAVARGFPMKRRRAASAVVNFGTVTDPIAFVAYP